MDQFVYTSDRDDHIPGDATTNFLMVWRSHWFLQQWMANLHRMVMSEYSDKPKKVGLFTEFAVELDELDLTFYDRDRLTAKLQGQYNDAGDTARDSRFIELARYHLSQGRRVFYFSEFGDDDE